MLYFIYWQYYILGTFGVVITKTEIVDVFI